MNQTQRDAQALVREAIRAVDAVFAHVASEVGRIVRIAPDPLTSDSWRWILRQIDRVLDRVFGLTQRAALTSELFRTIVAATDSAAERPFLRLLRRVEAAVTARDPALWGRIRLRLLTGPEPDDFARVAAVFEHWDEVGNRIIPRQVAERRRMLARTLDPQRRWVDPQGYRLSDRVWRQGRIIRRNIDREIWAAIRNGESPLTLARRLEDYLNPERAPMRFLRDGRIVTKYVSTKPTGAGHGSSYARTLARTEVMRVHGAATIESARTVPGVVGIRWMLSGSHPKPDPCDDAASRDFGLGPGVYPLDNPPRYPLHPSELCVLSHEHMPRGELVDLIVARYGT